MTQDINNLIDFVDFSHDIRNVKRVMWVKDQEEFENDSEHAYQLALTALYIIESDKLALNSFKAMSLALVHDILEVYAGDTPVFG
ncbi:MAG: HD domain-containing protein, partial [Candidatus Saccharimonadales bacterium]